MKDYKPLIVIVVVLAAVIGVILYAKPGGNSPFKPSSTPQAQPQPTQVLTLPAHARGNLQSTVIIEEFGDYQCPSCAAIAPILKQIEHDYEGQVRFQFSHFTIPSHSFGVLAARAAEAAGKQGKFWEMHDKLYEKQQEWGKLESGSNKSVKTEPEVRAYFDQYAKEIGLDVEQFKRDLDAPDTEKQITSDKRRGIALNVQGTPSLFMMNTANPLLSRPQMLAPEYMAKPKGEGIRQALDFLLGKPLPPAPQPTGKPNAK